MWQAGITLEGSGFEMLVSDASMPWAHKGGSVGQKTREGVKKP
jgi:hypothetical protein